MASWMFFFIMSAIYMAPSLSRRGREIAAIINMSAAVVCIGREAFKSI